MEGGVFQHGPKIFNGNIITDGNGITNRVPSVDAVFKALTVPPGGFIPFSAPNYISIDADGTAVVNGTRLLAALTAAYLLTPNAVALSATNRAQLWLLPGVYDIGANFLAVSQFVDIYGMGDPKDIVITSSNAAGTIHVANANNYILTNLTINNTGTGGSIIHNAAQTDAGTWNNLILGQYTTAGTIFSGRYDRITGLVDEILNGNISGTVSNSTFQNHSCGGSAGIAITISGTIYNCRGLTRCFGASQSGAVTLTSTSTIFNCKALDRSFGASDNSAVVIDGLIYDCQGVNVCFGGSDTGATVDITGTIYNCKGMYFCCGYAGSGIVTVSGIIGNCVNFVDACFCASNTGTAIMTGYIYNCSAQAASFGYSGAGAPASTVSGTYENCIGINNCFGNTNATGKLIGCKRSNPYGVHAGTIDRCNFKANDAVNPAISVANGAIIKYSTFYQASTGGCIDGAVATTVSIYHNAMNVIYNPVNITNNIAAAFEFNTIDVNIIIN